MPKSISDFIRTGVWIIPIYGVVLFGFTYIFVFEGCNNTEETGANNENVEKQLDRAKLVPDANNNTLFIEEAFPIDNKRTTLISEQLTPNKADGYIKLPDTFGKVYDYYIKSPDFYFCNNKGVIYQLKSMGIAVKISNPVKVIMYESSNKGSSNSINMKYD